jgi:hypothetical protein
MNHQRKKEKSAMNLNKIYKTLKSTYSQNDFIISDCELLIKHSSVDWETEEVALEINNIKTVLEDNTLQVYEVDDTNAVLVNNETYEVILEGHRTYILEKKKKLKELTEQLEDDLYGIRNEEILVLIPKQIIDNYDDEEDE